ncbi:MAG TPA: helix-turn-helix domain-containing protein [Solirubrobacteraceae bacterium]|nr:helix-turn-helix domain-containing protein [Solirubrobacteraceae bacterium]
MEKESLQLLLNQGFSIERIAKRFGKDPSTVSYWMKKHGLESPSRERHAAKGGIDRERLEELVEAGLTIAEIAEAVARSKATVRHWLRVYGLSTQHLRGSRYGHARAAARAAGFLTVQLHCRNHGETDFVLEGRGSYRCKRCRSERVTERRRRAKAILVDESGGQCVLCGYGRDFGALEFHHLDPECKRLTLSSQGVTYSLDALRAEAQKCVLLCANCHREVEHGVASLPVQF